MDFNYQDPECGPATKFAMLSMTLHDITREYNIAGDAASDDRDPFSSTCPEKLLDYRTVRKTIESISMD